MQIYPVEIDFSVGVGTRVKISRNIRFRLDHRDEEPATRTAVRGTVSTLVPLALFVPGRAMSLCELDQILNDRELIPAQVVHLLCFIREHPEAPASSTVIALGSPMSDGTGLYAPCIRNESECSFDIMCVSDGEEPQPNDIKFSPHDRILVIPRFPERFAA